MLLGIYMALCYLLVTIDRELDVVAYYLIFSFHSEDYPVHVYAYCLVERECSPYIYRTGLRHPLL